MACVYGDQGPKWLGVGRSTWTPLALSSAAIMLVVGGVFAFFHFQMHAPLLFQALTGGVGGAALPFFIASCIGIIKTRHRPEPPQEEAPEANPGVEHEPAVPVDAGGHDEDGFEKIGSVDAPAAAGGKQVTLQKGQLVPIYTALGELFAALLKIHDGEEKKEGPDLIGVLFEAIIAKIPEEIELTEEELAALVERLKMRVEQLAEANFDESLNTKNREIREGLKENGNGGAATALNWTPGAVKGKAVPEMTPQVTQMLLGWLADFPYFNQLYAAKQPLINPIIRTLGEKLSPAVFDLIFIKSSKVRKKLVKATDDVNGKANEVKDRISVDNVGEILGEIAAKSAAFAKKLAS